MKHKITFLLFTLIFIPGFLLAQETIYTNPRVKKAVYFDKTPPMTEMKIILPGERDRSWKDNVIPNDQRDETELYANFVQPGEDLVQQKEMGTRGVEGPIYNFNGVGRLTPLSPPDTDGDVGPNHYFQMINVSYAIWDKQGNLLYGPVDNSTLWNGFIGPWTGTNDGDPIVLYDELADRWIATQFAVNTSNGTYWELVAVSTSPDPTGSYYRYAFQFTYFNDYPKFSVWPDAYYATYNMFAGSYLGATITALERDSMLVGSPNARMIEFGPFNSQYGAKTANFDGTILPPSGSPNWVANLNKYGSPQTLEIYKFEVDWNNTANSTYVLWDDLVVTPFNFFPPNIRDQLPQPNVSQLLDPLSKYLMYPLQYRNFGSYEVMLVNHTVQIGNRAGIRWYEMRKDSGQDNWYLYQEGTYAPNDDESRWMASLAMNAAGDIALGFSVTGDTTYPSIRYTGRSASTPLGEMDIEEVTVVHGTGSQTGTARWGDYSAMSVDPSDDSTFWYTQEYMPGSVWGTRIVSFDLGPLQPPTAFAGEDSVICSEEVYYGQGIATSASSYLWTTDGDGVLMFENTLQPAYVRGEEDLEKGYFELVFNVTGYLPGSSAEDTIRVDLQTDVIVDAGNDTLVCIGESIILQPEIINGDSVMWTTAGDGTFNDPNIPNAIYTPGPDDIANGSVLLNLYATSAPPCEGDDADDITLTIDDCTFIGENDEASLSLDVFPNPSGGIFNFTVNSERYDNFNLKVLNMQGQVVFSGRLNFNDGTYKNELDFSLFPKGIYYLLISSEGQSITKKIIFK